MNYNLYKPGVGPTKELSLRVSVSSLVRVLIKNPSDRRMMIVLERTATLLKDGSNTVVEVRAKPFGGAARILRTELFRELIGDFHFDSDRSFEERDFRIQIHPGSWEKIIELCMEYRHDKIEKLVEFGPARELSEEFSDSLHIKINPSDYDLTPSGLLIDDRLTATKNVNARGYPTKRIYFLFEALVKNREIIDMIMDRQGQSSDQVLRELAYDDARFGGRGRANDILVTYFDKLEEFCRIDKNAIQGFPFEYMGHQLDGNVPVILNKEYSI